jgi:hypothetical protein
MLMPASSRPEEVSFIGPGGMEEVYEADDLELRERVALKTVRSEAALDRNAIEHFSIPGMLAWRLTNRNWETIDGPAGAQE